MYGNNNVSDNMGVQVATLPATIDESRVTVGKNKRAVKEVDVQS